ncbi:DUF1289 domain-containing protein [Xanthobacter autotrophicus DSM 431]|uniref:DUF1289 domain-containing protein n=1 Tax=Xanthobacter nonsaccharivorans TaxID=3119912 RepID=UPI0037290245
MSKPNPLVTNEPPPSDTVPTGAAPAIATPCIKLCVVEPLSSLCIGCGRSLREIGAWASYTPQDRAAIMATLPARLQRLKAMAPEAYLDHEPE